MKLVSPIGQEVSAGPRLSHPVTRDGCAIPFFPVGRRLIVERLPPETEIVGIYIPDTHQAAQQYATIVAAGPAAQGILDDMGIRIGDTVCFGKYSGVYWEWQPTELPKEMKNRRRVDLISIEDVYGCRELAEKMIDGRLGIALYKPDGDDGEQEYRFFEEVKRG